LGDFERNGDITPVNKGKVMEFQPESHSPACFEQTFGFTRSTLGRLSLPIKLQGCQRTIVGHLPAAIGGSHRARIERMSQVRWDL
jgi:hypothetical protein